MRTINVNNVHNVNNYIMPAYSPNLNQYDVKATDTHTCETWLTSNKKFPKCAVIELSTSSVKLLVNLDPVATVNEPFEFDHFFRKSERTDTGLLLSFDNMLNIQSFVEKVLPVIKEYECLARTKHHVDVIYTVATAAYRTAGNKGEILRLIKKETGLNVRILPKDEEATATLWAYIFSTHNKAKLMSFENHILLDQGAGSTEISLFKNRELVFSHSFGIGSILLKSLLFRKLSMNLEEAISDIQAFATIKTQKELDSLEQLPTTFNKSFCLGVGKSITEATGKSGNRNQHEKILTIETMKSRMESVKTKLCDKFSTVEELKTAIDRKKDNYSQQLILCLALPVVISILEKFHIQELTVNGTGLFYGVFFEKFFNLN
ncbi:MAG: hypothetical protein J6Y35_02765 [Bacteroidales bacterium]|nr:hypothetical protein [Bacteroidales bacterium]